MKSSSSSWFMTYSLLTASGPSGPPPLARLAARPPAAWSSSAAALAHQPRLAVSAIRLTVNTPTAPGNCLELTAVDTSARHQPRAAPACEVLEIRPYTRCKRHTQCALPPSIYSLARNWRVRRTRTSRSTRHHWLMAVTLWLNPDDEQALALLAAAEGVSKPEAAVRAIREAASRKLRQDKIRSVSADAQERYAGLLDRLGR